MNPLRLVDRSSLTLAAVLSSGLAFAAPAAGILEQVTLQDGAWSDPATWELGIVPVDPMVDSIAYLQHIVDLTGPGAATLVFVGVGGSSAGLILQGGALDCDGMSVGRSAPGFYEHRSGTTDIAGQILVGSLFDGSLIMRGGQMNVENMYAGGLPDVPTVFGAGTVAIHGDDATLVVSGELVVSDVSQLSIFPDADGAAGLSTIQAGSVEFEPGSSLSIAPNHPAALGESWDVIQSATPIVGLPTLPDPGVWEYAFDTSDPNVLRVVVVDSPFPVWTDLGGGSPGANGVPTLTENTPFPLVAGAPTGLTLTNGPNSAPTLLLGSFSSTPINVLGGTLHANPWTVEVFQFTDASGGISFDITWPAGIDPGIDLWVQYLCLDPSVPGGLTLSNGLTATTGD